MPLHDRRTMEGVYSVAQTAQMIRQYRYAEEQMMRIMAGWIALTPELVVKLEFGRQVWDCAQHADILGKRLPELRARAQVSEPPNATFVTFMQTLANREQPEETIERLVGVFRVLKPHLLSVYTQHLSACNPVYEPPTIRILERLVRETQEHILKGQILLEDMACTVPTRERAVLWQLELEKQLVAAGGVCGTCRGCDMTAPPTLPVEQAAEAHAQHIVLGDSTAMHQDCIAQVRQEPPDLYAQLGTTTFTRYAVLGHARIGLQHIFKIRYFGATTVTLHHRLGAVEGQWCVLESERV